MAQNQLDSTVDDEMLGLLYPSIRIGPLPDSSLIATRVGTVRVVACASPGYLAARGRPLTPKAYISTDE